MMILNKSEIDFVQSALIGLSNRQPKVITLGDSVWLKIKTLSELTEMDKKVLALAIQGKCMYDGPTTWPVALSTIEKIGLNDLLKEYLESWASYPDSLPYDFQELKPEQAGE